MDGYINFLSVNLFVKFDKEWVFDKSVIFYKMLVAYSALKF